MKLCAHLQCKALIGRSFADPEELALALLLSDSPFSCLHTTQPWGPDQSLCAPERCQPGRACFERSPRDPSAPVA